MHRTASSRRRAACATRWSPRHRRPLMALNHPPSRRCRRCHRPRRRRQRRRSRRRCRRRIAWIGPRCFCGSSAAWTSGRSSSGKGTSVNRLLPTKTTEAAASSLQNEKVSPPSVVIASLLKNVAITPSASTSIESGVRMGAKKSMSFMRPAWSTPKRSTKFRNWRWLGKIGTDEMESGPSCNGDSCWVAQFLRWCRGSRRGRCCEAFP
jgi:hypothetical protein